MEFHVSKKVRDLCKFDGELFSFNGNVIFSNPANVRKFAYAINASLDPVLEANKMIKAGQLNAMGLIDEILHLVCKAVRKQENPKAFEQLAEYLGVEEKPAAPAKKENKGIVEDILDESF